MAIRLVGQIVVACICGLMLIFQIFAFTPIASNNSVTPSSWALSSDEASDPLVAQQVDVSAAMKQTKRVTLLSIRNNGESTLHSVEVKNPAGAISLVKAKEWDGEQLDPRTVKVSTNDRPIKRGGSLILLVLTENFASSLQWSVGDSIGKVLASGTVKERAKQPQSKPIAIEGTDKQVKNQTTTHDNVLIIKVVDGNSKRPVEDATIIIIDSSSKVLAGKTTDSNGEIKLIVPSGNYKLTIQANSYNKLLETLQVHGDIQKTFELTRTSSVTIRTTSTIN